jgi:hypothetical protein
MVDKAAMESEKTGRKAAIHREITLPPGMSPAQADALESRLCAWYDEQDELPLEFGVRLFGEFFGTHRSS